MKIHPSITLDRISAAIASQDNLGFCIACGSEAIGIEPDARHYDCDSCDAASVYGAEELIFYIQA